jgi:hypothetical protein
MRDVRQARTASEAGFDHHLVKPVDVDSLASLIEQSTAQG